MTTTKKAFSEVRAELTEIVNHVSFAHDRYILTRNGKDVAAIVSMDDLKFIEDMEDKIDVEIAKRVDAEIEREGTVKWEDIKRDLGL